MTKYVWRVKTRLSERYLTPCKVLARGKMNTCLIEFEDGYRVATSRNYVIKQATLLAAYMVKCQNHRITLTTINARMSTQVFGNIGSGFVPFPLLPVPFVFQNFLVVIVSLQFRHFSLYEAKRFKILKSNDLAFLNQIVD